MSNIFEYAPNASEVLDTVNSTAWHKVDTTGNTGGTDWPNQDAGLFLLKLTLRSKTSADADGSPFEYALNKASAPSVGEVVSSTQPMVPINPGRVNNVWIKKSVGTDVVQIVGRY